MWRSSEREKIRLGLCAMAKKINSKPMKAICEHIEHTGRFEIVLFPEETILHAPIEEWPQPVDFLISFFSEGFPLEKAEAYVELRKPHLINDLTAQHLLLDRRRVYGLLSENGIPCPAAIVVERDETGTLIGDAAQQFVESDDYIIVGNTKLEKPFVEKPVDSEDHNVCIYYPSSAGGGIKNLFRKVGNKSSEYDGESSRIRRNGTYMYESFLQTGGIDIKVYTVGPDYAHAEARKSPVLDGSVNRDKNGKEVRTPVVLTPMEKEIARRVSTAFGQMVCGFDMLRTSTKSFVIDVNGWSFVKGVAKYYEDASSILMQHMLRVMGKSAFLPVSRTVSPSEQPKLTKMLSSRAPGADLGRWEHQELLAVVAVMRHADRTPKNKMKLLTRRHELISLHEHWAKSPQHEAKLKTPEQLQEVLDLSGSMLQGCPQFSKGQEAGADLSGCIVDPMQPAQLDDKERDGLYLLHEVLSGGERFSGIYRKVQLKPTAWNQEGKVEELMLILKYGGTLTPAGRAQAAALAQRFRREMYPGEKDDEGLLPASTDPTEQGGLLRLHATQRHDFKVYSSDEGRVQMSAAAFTKGLLGLEGNELTPICVALVETKPAMLDDLPAEAEALMKDAKAKLNEQILGSEQGASPKNSPGIKDLEVLHGHICQLCQELLQVDLDGVKLVTCGPDRSNEPARESGKDTCCSITKPILIVKRWQKLRDDLYDSKKSKWDLSKVMEIYDAVKFDMIHNQGLAAGFEPVFAVAKSLNDVIVPLEYGDDLHSRSEIGAKLCNQLTAKILADLQRSAGPDSVTSELPEWSLVTASQFLRRSVAKMMGARQPSKEAPDEETTSLTRKDSLEADFASLSPDFAHHLMNPTRRVRTRLYFTSESHIQSMMNVLRYCHHRTSDSSRIVSEEAEEQLRADPVFDYLTQIVFRLYEDKLAQKGSEDRYRVEILFSPGANDHPSAARGNCHTMPLKELRPLHQEGKPLTLKCLQKLLEPYAASTSSSDAGKASSFAKA
eukprot:TRINITY_DN88106_c0_g1_i1.p1 TRINITY_DN88106_c0_g1~~TRINITY_DN88106_c0_g1_i1.p1  ORF type:complete len:1006 (-),score=185.55 TRINITY_DN88106_c0_g1_i1:431-3448(-)